jgi:hypothetical protein
MYTTREQRDRRAGDLLKMTDAMLVYPPSLARSSAGLETTSQVVQARRQEDSDNESLTATRIALDIQELVARLFLSRQNDQLMELFDAQDCVDINSGTSPLLLFYVGSVA